VALLDVNALVALVWDSHVHHAAMRAWFTTSGFVRVSSNPIVLPSAIGVAEARRVLSALRARPDHRFLTDDVSISDRDVPSIAGYRQVTDAHLLTLARRNRMRLVTFDASIFAMADGSDVELLATL
jgi:toxin-antitoxin system PIN domain toxin